MKRFLTAIIFILSVVQALAGPASRKPFAYVQPDGSEILLVRHGDENRHWTTLTDGTRVEKDADGFYRPALSPMNSAPSSAPVMRAPVPSKKALSLGEKHFLVILIDFPDLHFRVPNPRSAFSSMLNAKGYSENGGTGSARDYFVENSGGAFRPVFDVLGPVTVDNSYSYYGQNSRNGDDMRPDFLLYEACQKLDKSIDFSRYDNDGDGVLDNIFFYYAGYNEAEGGDEDTIWPHSWSFTRFNATLDGIKFNNYACTSELSGNRGVKMCGIGTFCHEFCHTLGLMDMYDTDLEENGEYGRDDYDLMSSGNYNNDNRTPPYLNSYERYLLGWQRFPSSPTGFGKVNVSPVQNGGGLCIPTSEEGEFFLIETRDGTGWDKYVGPGYLIYHVDVTDNPVEGIPARDRWEGNTINAVGDHPCFGLAGLPLAPWYGKLQFSVSDLSYTGTGTTLSVAPAETGYILGTVSDADGRPLKFALVSLGDASVRTDGSGRFMIPASGEGSGLVVSCPGYGMRELDVTGGANVDVVMHRESSFSFIRIDANLMHGVQVVPEFVSSYTPVSIKWYVDAKEVSSPFVLPAAGEYKIRAEVICPDGTVESVFQIIEVR